MENTMGVPKYLEKETLYIIVDDWNQFLSDTGKWSDIIEDAAVFLSQGEAHMAIDEYNLKNARVEGLVGPVKEEHTLH